MSFPANKFKDHEAIQFHLDEGNTPEEVCTFLVARNFERTGTTEPDLATNQILDQAQDDCEGEIDWGALYGDAVSTSNVVDISEELSREYEINEASRRQADDAVGGYQTLNDAIILGDPKSPEAQDALALPITIMRAGTRLTAGHNWTRNTGSVGQLIEHHLSKHPVVSEKDGVAFVYASGVEDRVRDVAYAQRIQNSIESVNAIAFDIDGTDEARRVAERIAELELMGVVYTTHSHDAKKTETGDWLRGIIVLEEPIHFPNAIKMVKGKARPKMTEARREAINKYHVRYAGLCDLLGLTEIDASAMNLHQMMYTPRRATEDAAFEHYVIYGKALRYEDMPIGDAAKYRNAMKAPSGAMLSKKDSVGPAVLSDGFDLAEWWDDGGCYLMIADVLDFIGWDVRGGYGWTEMMCPNAALHSDPNDDAAGFHEGEDGFAIHCFHDHCLQLGTWQFLVLIEQALLSGEAVLPDGVESFSALLCDPAFYPDEIDGEPVEFDPADYGVVEEIEINFLGSARKVERAFKAVAENDRSGDDDFAALYAGVEKAGSKTAAVKALKGFMTAANHFDGNDLKRIAKRGSEMLKAERAAWKVKKGVERKEVVAKAMERGDLAHPSMDPAEPLGNDLESSLATLRKRFAPVDINGKFRVVRKPDFNAFNSNFDSTIVVYQKQDFMDLHLDRQIPDEEGLIDPAKTFLGAEKRKSGLVFAPPPVIPGANDFNMYLGRKLDAAPCDFPTLRRFIFHVVCDSDEDKYRWLILWMAHMVQRPGEKPGTAVVAIGDGGVGKGTFGSILMKLTAPHSKQLENESHVTGQFAGEHLSKCILVVVNEAVFGLSPRVSSTLKAHVDSTSIQVEAKGMNLTTVPSFTRFYFDSNDAVPVRIENNGSERRYFVLKFSDVKKGDYDYFRTLRNAIDGEEISGLLAYLMQYDPAPAGMTWDDVRTAPLTPEREVMGTHSMRPAVMRLKEVLEEGQVTLWTPEGAVTFAADSNGLRVPRALFRDHISGTGDKVRVEDRDIPALFGRLFPDFELSEGQGTVGALERTRWWEFPSDVIDQ